LETDALPTELHSCSRCAASSEGAPPSQADLASALRLGYLSGFATSASLAFPDNPGPGGCLRQEDNARVAKVSPGEFIRQVRAETAKVVWPTGRETMMTAVMVVIMTTILAVFFFGLDSAFSALNKALLSLVTRS